MAGYFQGGEHANYIALVPGREADDYRTIFHEYTHFIVNNLIGVVPPWINEGLGDYFFGGDWQKSPRKFSIGINDWRVKRIQDAVKANKHVPIAQIIRYDQAQYYRNPGLCYAEGWAINYFLLTSPAARNPL